MSKIVSIYSTPTCGYCHMLKDYLKEKSVDFTDYNVAEDQEKAQEMVNKTGQMGVPVTIITDNKAEEVIVGFDKTRINELLDIEE